MKMDPEVRLFTSYKEAIEELRGYESQMETYGEEDAHKPCVIALDVETTGLDLIEDTLHTVQLFNPANDYVSVFVDKSINDDWRNNDRRSFPYMEWLIAVLEAAANNPNGIITAHNATFDLSFIDFAINKRDPIYQENGPVGHVRWHKRANHWSGTGNGYKFLYDTGTVEDTAIAAKVLWPDSRVGLKPLADSILGEEASLPEKELKAHFKSLGCDWKTIPSDDPVLVKYGARDAVLQAALHKHIFSEVADDDALSNVIGFESLIDYYYATVSSYGICVDDVGAGELRTMLEEETQAIATSLDMDYGIKKVHSNKQVADAIVKEGGKLTKTTPSGKKKVDAEVLKRLADGGSSIAKKVLTCKQNAKMNTWLIPLAESNGVIRPSIRTLAAITGRSSITNPPLQQLPRDDKRIRKLILPGDYSGEEESVVSIDYSQIELRVLASISGDGRMKKIFNDGEDLHLATAKMIFPNREITSKERYIAKTTNFGMVYGGGPKTLAAAAGINENDAKSVLERWSMAFPQVKAYTKRVQNYAFQKGYVSLLDGRKIPVNRKQVYRALNYTVQGNAALLFKRGFLNVVESNLDLLSRIMFVVHDEIVFSFPMDSQQEYAECAAKQMKNIPLTGVPVVVDIDYQGPNWAGEEF